MAIVAATDQFLVLDEAEVWLDTSRVAVHHQANGAGWRQYTGLRVADSVQFTKLNSFIPGTGSSAKQALRTPG